MDVAVRVRSMEDFNEVCVQLIKEENICASHRQCSRLETDVIFSQCNGVWLKALQTNDAITLSL